ncbi:Plasmid partition protein ParA-like protein [Vibrio crassostreae]|nr:Plasmid partition protein ParA-like protein [Vibrio crassostreae]
MKKVIVVGSTKGGAGKTTLVIHLAAYHERLGGKVLIVEVDPSGASKMWVTLRKSSNIVVKHYKTDLDLADEMIRLKEEYSDHLVIVDCGGFDNKAMRTAITSRATDAVIIPSKPSLIDLAVARPFIIQTAKALEGKKPLRGCIMEANPLPNMAKEIWDTKAAMEKFGMTPLVNLTYKRNAYKENYLDGGDGLSHNSKALDDIKAIYEEINSLT